MAYKWGLLSTYKSWDDPPSTAESLLHDFLRAFCSTKTREAFKFAADSVKANRGLGCFGLLLANFR